MPQKAQARTMFCGTQKCRTGGEAVTEPPEQGGEHMRSTTRTPYN